METIMSKSEAVKMRKNKEHLPFDLIFEILIRTDIESFPTLRCVCKGWCNLLYQPHFINHHHQRTKNIRGFIFRPKPDWAPTNAISFLPHPGSPSSEALPALDFLPERVKIEASTRHGILCCVGLHHRRNYYVCKPTTKEWTPIPAPRTRYETLKMDMVVAIENNILTFKIVRISKYKGESQLFHWEVFDSKTWKWAKLDHIESLMGSMDLASHSVRTGIVVNGCCFCFLVYKNNGVARIMAFDVWREELGTLQIPKQTLTHNAMSLVNIDGNLGLISSPNGLEQNVWEMSSLVDQRWEEKVSFNMHEDFGWRGLLDFVRFVVDEVFFMLPAALRLYRMWCFLNLKDKSYTYVEAVDNRVYIPDTVFFFESDYFPCNIRKRQPGGGRQHNEAIV